MHKIHRIIRSNLFIGLRSNLSFIEDLHVDIALPWSNCLNRYLGKNWRANSWIQNENLQGLIEFRSKFASRSFTRDWLMMRTVIHGFSHFNYAMLHYGALYYTLLKYTSPLRGLFPPCWLPPSTRFPALPPLFFKFLSPSCSFFLLSKHTLLLEHVPSSFSFFPILTADRTSTYLSILSGFRTSFATSCIFKFTFFSFSFLRLLSSRSSRNLSSKTNLSVRFSYHRNCIESVHFQSARCFFSLNLSL